MGKYLPKHYNKERDEYNKELAKINDELQEDEVYGKLNPYTGNFIKTKEDFEVYKSQRAFAQAMRKVSKEEKDELLEKIKKEQDEKKAARISLGRSRAVAIALAIALLWTIADNQPQKNTSAEPTPYVNSTAIQTPKPPPKLDLKEYTAITPMPTINPELYEATESGGYHTGTKMKAGYAEDRTVYVSTNGRKIHLRRNCSGMKYYSEMTYEEACERGYSHCSNCF